MPTEQQMQAQVAFEIPVQIVTGLRPDPDDPHGVIPCVVGFNVAGHKCATLGAVYERLQAITNRLAESHANTRMRPPPA